MSNYRLVASDYKTDKMNAHLAGAQAIHSPHNLNHHQKLLFYFSFSLPTLDDSQEMMANALVIAEGNIREIVSAFENAFTTYHLCGDVRRATRCAMQAADFYLSMQGR